MTPAAIHCFLLDAAMRCCTAFSTALYLVAAVDKTAAWLLWAICKQLSQCLLLPIHFNCRAMAFAYLCLGHVAYLLLGHIA